MSAAREMRAFEDPDLPPGMVVIGVEGHLSGTQTVTIAGRRGELRYLGPNGWQTAPHGFEPSAVRHEGGDTLFEFGPEVTQWLDLDTQVTVSISPAGVSASLFWPEVTPAPANPDGILGFRRAEPRAEGPEGNPPGSTTADDPLEPPAPEPPLLEPEPDEGRTVLLDPPSVPAADDQTTDDEAPAPPIKKRVGWAPALVLALVVLAVAAGVVWVMLQAGDDQAEAPQDERQVTATAQPEDPAPREVPLFTPDEPSFADRLSSLLEQEGGADDLHALALEAYEADETDIGDTALSAASDRGSVAAAMQLADWYDPLTDGVDRVEPNANLAALLYSEASDLGEATAQERIDALCDNDVGDDFDFERYC